VDLPVRGQPGQMGVAGEAVQERELRPRGQEALGLMLPVDLHQARAELGQGSHRGKLPTGPGGRPAVSADAPSQDQLAVLGPLGGAWDAGGLEQGLHPGPLLPRTDQARVGPAAQHQGEAHGHHGLSRPGLAGQDVEPRSELQVHLVDDAQAGDVELEQHAPDSTARRRRPPGWFPRGKGGNMPLGGGHMSPPPPFPGPRDPTRGPPNSRPRRGPACSLRGAEPPRERGPPVASDVDQDVDPEDQHRAEAE
jgi:hypothetical protein